MSDIFKKLSKINVSDKIEKKGNLNYLSWAWAWEEFKKNVPDGNYKVYEDKDGRNYHNDGKTAWVKVGVIAGELEHIEYLPIMDFKNKSIQMSALTSMDVNKAIQRALTKGIARHGLGLYIYAGEDLPETIIEEIAIISQDQVLTLVKLIADAKTTMAALFKNLNWDLKKLEQIQADNFDFVKKTLEDKIERQKEEK